MPSEMKVDGGSSVVMGALDVRDAFLQAEQDEPVLVHLQNEPFIIMRNLPGQHLGAKQWYLHLRFSGKVNGIRVLSRTAMFCKNW